MVIYNHETNEGEKLMKITNIEPMDYDYSKSEFSMDCMNALSQREDDVMIATLIAFVAIEKATELKNKGIINDKQVFINDFRADMEDYLELVAYNNFAAYVSKKYACADFMDDDKDNYYKVLRKMEKLSYKVKPKHIFRIFHKKIDEYIAKLK